MARATDFLSQTSGKLDEMFQTRQTDHGTILARNPKRRGIGIDRATDAIGEMKLPAYKAQSGDDYTRITLYPKKKVSEMTREERIAVCYQHACLLYEDGMAIGNQSVRERFNINTKQSAMASRILADTLESGLIKMENPETESKRYTSYIPFYG